MSKDTLKSAGDEPKRSAKQDLDPTVHFFAGTIAGIAGLAVGFPLDTVKVRFQGPDTAKNYKGLSTFATVTKIITEERIRGLYKGITSPMAGYAFLNGLVFSGYGFFMKLQLQHESDQPTIAQIGLAGAGSGIVASLITCPTDLIKIRQQAIVQSQPSSREIALGIIQTHGLPGLFRGMGATALRDCGYGAYFASYEAACQILRSPHTQFSRDSEARMDPGQLSLSRQMLAGGFAGIMGWLATFGLDVVKTRVQASENTPTNPFRNTVSTVVHSYKAQGLRVFFVGLSPTLIRAFPVNMVTFGVFELVAKIFS